MSSAEPVFGVLGGVDADQEQDEVEENDDAGADEARLLGDNGKDEIRVAFRQKGHLALRPLAVPLAGDLAGADGDLRLVRVIAAAERIGAGVDERLDPVLLIRLERTPDLVPHGRHKEDHRYDDRDGEQDDDEGPQVDARQHGDQQGRQKQHDRRSEVRLLQHQQEGDQDHGAGHGEVLQFIAAALGVFGEVPRKGERQRELGELGRLKHEGADGEPALRAHAGPCRSP